MPSLIARSKRAVLAVGLGLALSAQALPALAQPPNVDPAVKKDAETIFQSGLKHYDAREFEKARAEFKKAYGMYPSPAILRNLALSESYGNHPLEALRHWQEYLANNANIPQDKRDEAKKYIDEAYAKTGHLKITATEGVAIIAGDRTYTAPLSAPIDVAPGNLLVIARGMGREVSKDVVAVEGKVVDVDLTFPAQGTATEPNPGTGPSGQNNNGNDHVTLPPVEPPPSSSTRYIVSGGLVALGLVGVGVGVGFTVAANGSSDDLARAKAETGGESGSAACVNSPSPACQARSDAAEDLASNTNIAVAGYVAGGAAIVGGALAFVLWPKSKSAGTSGVGGGRLVPSLGSRAMGFVYQGEF